MHKNRIALAPVFAQNPPMPARVLSAALSRQSAGSATADINGIEAFPVEVEVNSGWGDTVIVIIMSISHILKYENRDSPKLTLGRIH